MPLYFTDNNLINWKKSYADIIKAFSNQKDFSVYEEVEYKLFDNNTRVLAGYKLNILPRQYQKFKIVLTFAYCSSEAEKNTKSPSSFQVHYRIYSDWPLAPEDDFEINYRQKWENLSELEQYAVAFSSNLFGINKQNQLDFSNNAYAERGKNILKDSWGITDYQGLKENHETLIQGGHHGAYNNLLELLNKNKGKTVLEIAKKEGLGVIETTRLYYVQKMKDVLGSHGIEAWDQGRQITLLRWGIGAGYISYDEAIELIKPLVENIKSNYVSWTDFMAHYIAGRAFYGLFDSDYTELTKNAIEVANQVNRKIPYESLNFSASSADRNKVMTFDKSFYLPSQEAKKWEEVQKLFAMSISEETLAKLEEKENEFPECAEITFWWHLDMLRKLKAEDAIIISYIEKFFDYINSLPSDNPNSINTKYNYMYLCNNCGQPQKALKTFETFPDDIKKNVYIYYQYACSYYILSVQSPAEAEKNIYQSRAVEAFRQCEKLGLQLNEFIKSWIESVD